MKSKPAMQFVLLFSLGMLCLMLFLAVYGTSRSAWLARWIDRETRENWKAHRDRFSLSGAYSSLLARVILEDVYEPGFGCKKVYLVGACVIEELLDSNRISVRERQDIENLGIPGSDFIDLKHLLDWLRRDFGFGQNFDARTLILVGVYWGNAQPHGNPVFRAAFESSGLYDYSQEGEIGNRHFLKPLRLWYLTRARVSNFIVRINYLRNKRFGRGHRVRPTTVQPEIDDTWAPRQLAVFRQLLKDMKATRAKVKIIILPSGSWFKTPRRTEITRQILEVCQQENLDVLNLSQALEDKQFVDQSHLAVEGQQAAHSLVFPLIHQHMMDTE